MLCGSLPAAFSGLVLVETVGLMSDPAEGLPLRLGRGIAAAVAAHGGAGASSTPGGKGRAYPSTAEAAAARKANARA